MAMYLMKSLRIGGTDLQKNISKIEKIIAGFLTFLCTAQSVYAMDISALDFNGDVIGKVIPDGSVINFDNESMGEIIGHITADGFVLNDEEDLIGGIVPRGMVISVNNEVIGKVNDDGSVTTANDSFVGKVLPNGLAVNNNYDIIGAVVSSGLVYNDNGNIVGRVSGDGKFYDLSGNNNGFVSANGYVFSYNADNKIVLIGKLIVSKLVISSNGKFLGSIAPDGKVMDLKKNNIGAIHANGFVYNLDDIAVGHVVDNGYAFKTDGSYLGTISYNGEIIKKGEVVAQAIFGGRVMDKEGKTIGFSLPLTATFNSFDGKYLGRLNPEGNVVKGKNIVGKIGASGQVVNEYGTVIGLYNHTGPLFDYLGQLKANASISGSVLSLEGNELGYMQKDRAFDFKEKEVGKLLNNHLSFDGSNGFIGISGINSEVNYKGEKYTISPYGYIFSESGDIDGANYPLSSVYTPQGNILANILSNGKLDSLNLNDEGKLLSSGYFLDNENKILGRTLSAIYATDFWGENLGLINYTNLIINNENQPYAKILPTGKVVEIKKANKEIGMMGNSSLSISINGDFIGTNIFNGQVKKAGEEIGKVSSSKYVIDNQGALYGKAVNYGVVTTKGCRPLGIVSENGDARTTKGVYLGMLLANNQVINDSEEVIGYVIDPRAVNGQNGEIIGVETPTGTVLNFKNQNLGCQDIRGKIRNSQNEIIGQIIPDAAVMSFDDKIIGYTDFNGRIVNDSNEEIAFMDIEGGIKDSITKEDIGVLFEYTVAFDNGNNYIGRINKNGDVIADNKEIIGSVDHTGFVRTKDGKTGYALNDLYVYNQEGNTVGYISKNGRIYSIMGEVKGAIYQGFVLDKKQNLIARGARDYYIRDTNHMVIGYLDLDGKVINAKNVEVGTLQNNGDIINAKKEVIAKAEPLQYYRKELLTNPSAEEGESEYYTDTENNVSQDNKTGNINKAGGSKNIGISVSPAGSGEERNENSEEDWEETSAENFDGKTVSSKKSSADRNREEYIEEMVDKANDKNYGEFGGSEAGKPKATNSKWWQNVVEGTTVSPYRDNDQITNVGPGGGIGPGGRYNPRRAAILQKLYSDRRQSLTGKVINANNTKTYTGWDKDWADIGYPKTTKNTSTLRVDMSKMITADKPIPAVLARSVISLGDAPVTAIVERNVYGDSGRNVIIPAGSRIIGSVNGNGMDAESRFDASSGGLKMEISWYRIIRPDGISFGIKSAETGDAEGRGGGALGYVDEQLLKKYTVPLLGTVATSAVAYLMASNEDATGEVETSKQQAAADARQNFLDKMDQILNNILESKEKIQAVTYIPAGTRIIVYPMQDLWLKTMDDIKIGGSSDEKEGDGHFKDVLIDEKKDNSQTKKVQGKNNNNNTNKKQNNTKGKQTNNKQSGSNTGALPPPSADGTGARMPEESKEDEGEIDLDF